MQVLEFRYMDKDDDINPFYEQRSRVYEYDFVFKRLDLWKDEIKTIHNTSCWGWECHNLFAKWLEQFWKVVNSDNASWELETKPENFIECDITQPLPIKSDVNLCISTLEHLGEEQQEKALYNLIESANKYIILTFDCPPVNVEKLEKYLWAKCVDAKNRLNPENSKYKHPSRTGINIVALVIKRN